MADPGDYDDLRGFDLSRLDLEHIELDNERPVNPLWRWVGGVLLLASVVVLATLGTKVDNSALSFFLSLTAIIVGLSIGRWLWSIAEARAAKADIAPVEPESREPASPLVRWTMFLIGAGSATTVIVLVRNGTLQQWFGEGALFAAAASAIGIGILLGRWLMLQGEAARAARANEDDTPIQINLPPWFKWVTLGGIILVGGIVLVMSSVDFGGGGAGLGGIGFACGIAAAIWIARRFDEVEANAKSARRTNARAALGDPDPRTIRALPTGRSRWEPPRD